MNLFDRVWKLTAMFVVAFTLSACKSEERGTNSGAPTQAAAPAKPDPDVECRQAASKFIAKMKKCELNMDGLDTSTFCPGKPGSATPEMMRSMADDSCDVIVQRISAAMDSK